MNALRRESNRGVCGFAKPAFEAVADAFADNFIHRRELGAACCMYVHGEKVVDLWGGNRNKATGEPWEEDTMVLVFSTTKGMSGLAIALAHSRGLLDYDERVSTYWPEFAQQGKASVTVRQLLSHQAGLFALDAPVDRAVIADLDRLAITLAEQKPAWPPGTYQAYHAISLGFYEGELLRRVDPRHRTLGQFFQEEIASPLGLDFFIRLPGNVPNSRLASVERANPLRAMFEVKPMSLALAMSNPRSRIFRAMLKNPGALVPLDAETVYARNLEVPSDGGVGTARAIAHAYSVFATGGRELGVRQETLRALMGPAIAPAKGFFDQCLMREWSLSLGFAKPSPSYRFGSASAFGTPGAGGSFGYADPDAGVGYAYVMNRMGATQGGDPREVAIRQAFHRAIGLD